MLDFPRWFDLNRREFDRQFSHPALELKEVIALDVIELLPGLSSIKIRSHGLHGPLPEIIIQVDPGDRLGTFDRLGSEATKLCAISRLRRELVDAFSGASFLSPRCWTASAWRGYSGMAGKYWLRRRTSSTHITGCGGRRSGGRSSGEITPSRTYRVSRKTRSWAQSVSLYGPHWTRIDAAI